MSSRISREIKLDVTWSYVKRQTAKMKLLPSVFSSLNSRVKIFAFVANSRRHFSIFMWFNEGLEEKNINSEVIFAVCRLRGQIGIPSSPSDKIAFNYKWILLIDVTLFRFSHQTKNCWYCQASVKTEKVHWKPCIPPFTPFSMFQCSVSTSNKISKTTPMNKYV